MNYAYGLTVPAGTLLSSPMEITAHLPAGMLDSGIASFPAGCEGLVGLRVLRGLFQIWPENTTEWLSGDDHTFNIPFHHELRSLETRVRIQLFNLDETNAHTIGVQFNVSVLEDKSPALLGPVLATFDEATLTQFKAVGEIYQNALEFRQVVDERLLPLLEGIWERLDPALSVRLRDLSLEELTKL